MKMMMMKTFGNSPFLLSWLEQRQQSSPHI